MNQPLTRHSLPRRLARLAVACGLSLGLAGSLAAQEPREVSSKIQPPPGPSTLPEQDGVIQLSLDQAVELALRHNLALVVERYTRTQAALGIFQSLGLYDLIGSASLEASDAKNSRTNATQADSSRVYRANAGVSQLLPLGTNVTFGYGANRTEISGGDSLVPNFYGNGFQARVDQPLLRNFGRIPTESQLLVAQVNSRVSRWEFERQVTLKIQEVANAYWDLVEAREQLKVDEESVGIARELHERNRIQVDVGTMAPLELLQSEANIATSEEAILRSTAAVGDAADNLRRLLNVPPGGQWDREIVPVTDPRTNPVTVDLAQAIEAGLASRPELQTQNLAVERAKIQAAVLRNQRLPQLDLSVGYSAAGSDLGFSDAFRLVRGLDFPSWSAGLTLRVPVQNRTAVAASVIADLDVERFETELEDLQSTVRTDVRTALRRVETAAKQIDAARSSREFREKSLDAERKRYENGMSTSFQITRIQQDLTVAKRGEVSAIVGYRRALTDFYRSTGRLLAEEKVSLRDDEPPVDRFTFHPGISRYLETDGK